jgi:hypothetical protein
MKAAGRIGIAVGLAACAFLGSSASAASSARQPTLKERAAITAALPQWLRQDPVGCVWLDISVSSIDRRFAKIEPRFLNATHEPCVRYASNGFWILKRTTRWRIIFNGSVWPSCALHVPRDVSRCTP